MIQDIRRSELERNKHIYQWHTIPSQNELGWDLPRYIKADAYEELPLLLQANDLRLEDFLFHRKIAYYNTLAENLKGNCEGFSPEYYAPAVQHSKLCRYKR